MKERLLFYTNEWDSVKEFMSVYNSLLASGYEVAFSTDSVELARRLSVGRVLVVKPNTYEADAVVSTIKLKKYPNALSLSKFLEVVNSE